ncbi:copper transporter [Brachybacterium sp. Z12]|uniref:copper transporter n=1 Tax=Brachybacterium sp. Z12 TaxID=2759167 RepID=UPI001862555A|nr:copper transporter [Brachybacterium sp. Z12]QNN83331.1 copper transporter [Brachybacterium sp. Z12]
MIDFRYHLVSLISVFLALAVGIVLGAGPLRENLGDQLAGQVEQLRTEQEQLRGETEELSAKNDQLATFIAELGPGLVAETLAGRKVAVLTDDSSTRPGIERIMELLDEAGVDAPVRIDLLPALWAPDSAQVRDEALQSIRGIAPAVLPADPDDELTDSALLSAVIPMLLSGDTDDGLTPELRAQLWQVLIDHQLVSVEGESPPAVDGVIYASAAPEELADENEDELVATERAQGLLTAQTSLLGEFDRTGLPAVVSAATPGNDASTGVLRTVRGDEGFDAISTTDRLQEPDGPLLSVLALVEQTRGGNGAYGTTGDAEERLPALPETRGLEEQAGDSESVPQPSDGGGEE